MAVHNKRIRVGLLLAGIALLVGAGVIGAFMRPPLEPDQVVEARFGDVSWNHEQHARMKEIASCQVCHHKARPNTVNPKPCRHCHKPLTNQASVIVADLHMEVPKVKYEGENGPPPMTAFHGRCVGCHRAMAKGPVGCRDCHAQTFVGQHGVVRWDHQAHARRIDMPDAEWAENDCQYCHHQDKEAKLDADYRACDACHKPAAVLGLAVATDIKKHEKLLHGDCDRCHTVKNPEEDLRTCRDCHPKWTVEGKKKDGIAMRPAIEQALHTRCQSCHNHEYDDLTDDLPVGCNECHEPDPSILADVEVGLIMWDHDRHAKYGEDMTCDKCHHTDRPDQPHMACNKCHGTGLYKNPPVAEALRKRCMGCHKEKKNGLVSWEQIATKKKEVDWYQYEAPDGRSFWWDHRAHAVAWSFSCRNCHHGILKKDDEFATGIKAKVDWTGKATRIQVCKTCHGPEGPVAGSPAEGTKAKPLHEAFSKLCLDCHQKLGGGPQQWEDYYKIEKVPPKEQVAANAADDAAAEPELGSE